MKLLFALFLLFNIQPPGYKPMPKRPVLEVIEHQTKDDRHVKIELPACKVTSDTIIFIGEKFVTFKEFWDKYSDGELVITEIHIKNGKVKKIVIEKE